MEPDRGSDRAAAEAYFAALWSRASAAWRAGDVEPARMADGATVPPDSCISTIARLVIQPGAPLDAVRRAQARLSAACPGQFLYPPASLHVSLLGCTPRQPAPATFDAGQVARIRHTCARVLGGARRVELVVTDFVVSPRHTRTLETFALG